MNNYSMAGENNALLETNLFFKPIRPFDSNEMQRLNSLQSALSDRLPFHTSMNGVSFEFQANESGPQSSNSSIEVVGFDMRDAQSTNSSWVLRVTKDELSIHCLKYTKWVEVSETLHSFANSIFQCLGQTTNGIASFGMRFLDAFNFDTDGSVPNPSVLFKLESDYVPRFIFTSQNNRFHSHKGWFGNSIEDGKAEILNHLNIDSGFIQNQGKRYCSTTINHTQTILGKDGNLAGSILGHIGLYNDDLLKKFMNDLHNENKNLLKTTLSNDALQRMGLLEA